MDVSEVSKRGEISSLTCLFPARMMTFTFAIVHIPTLISCFMLSL